MSADKVTGYVAVGGTHPLGELTLYGPFETDDAAHEWGNENLAPVGDFWVASVWEAVSP